MFGRKKLSKEEKKALKNEPTNFSGYLSNYKLVNGISAAFVLALVLIGLGLGTSFGGSSLWISGLILGGISGLLLVFLLMFQVKNDKRLIELKKEQQQYDDKMRFLDRQVREAIAEEDKEAKRWEEIERKAKKNK